jgi:hypothetical protein
MKPRICHGGSGIDTVSGVVGEHVVSAILLRK